MAEPLVLPLPALTREPEPATAVVEVKLCRTCRHWAPDDRLRLAGLCLLTRVGRDGSPRRPESLAVVWCDGVGALRTDPLFGCVQWARSDWPEPEEEAAPDG